MTDNAHRQRVARVRKNLTDYTNTLGSYIRNARSQSKRKKAQAFQRAITDIRYDLLGGDEVTPDTLAVTEERYREIRGEVEKINWHMP